MVGCIIADVQESNTEILVNLVISGEAAKAAQNLVSAYEAVTCPEPTLRRKA
jgi:hypothetical protein